MKKKKIFYIMILSIVALLFFFLGLYEFGKTQVNTGGIINRITTKFFDYNEITVYTKNEKIKYDLKVFYEKKCIYSNNQKQNIIDNAYGFNWYTIYYKEEFIDSICFFKKNNWHVNKYAFYINDSINKYFVSLKIIGPDSNSEIYHVQNSEIKHGFK